MSETVIKIQNCNNIASGEISIEKNKLNIFFGCNGSGKSTIARASYLKSQGEPLTELTPYGIHDDDALPSIDEIPYDKIYIFNEKYVEQYIYQRDTLLKDTFEVLIRTDEYDDAKEKIDEALSEIKTTIMKNKEIVKLQEQLDVLIGNIQLTNSGDGLIKRRGGIKSVLDGKGAYFNPPQELDELSPFFAEDTVVNWAEWRLKGFNEFGAKGRCPYCSASDTEDTKKINEVFNDSFDKASVEYASNISKAIAVLTEYIDGDKAKELLSLFGAKERVFVLETQLTKLGAEAKYLHDRLTAIMSFNGSSVDRDNIAELESRLNEMKVDFQACDTYFVTDFFKSKMLNINSEIDSLLEKVDILKGEIGRYHKNLREKIRTRTKDINDFLNIAGFKYIFEVELRGEDDARAVLKFILPDGNPGDMESTDKHLSWGERNAFALILFMFDAISNDADLIILDDPISSFDNNKKYAIINRLFRTGDKANSLYQRTVMMLTHDFEPMIDYIQTNSGRQDPSSVCAVYFENTKGELKCTPIKKDVDMLSSVVLLKELAMDSNIDIAARIACLRKFIEHQYKNPRDDSEAYNILSSLIHGRDLPTCDNEGKNELSDSDKEKGYNFIKTYIPEFNYDTVLDQFKPESLIKRYSSEPVSYFKMLILRSYIERNHEARERLRRTNDALRKYIDETNHIENDYLYSLDLRRFNVVPEHFMKEAELFVAEECS